MIDKATVDLILDTADIVDVVSDFVTLKKRGANYWGLCPFHNDRTPSFSVNKARGICKCFSCGEGGNALNFIMKHEQLSYHDALIYLANKYHIEVKERELTDEEKAVQTARDAMFMLNEWACQFFEKQLHETTEGKEIGLSYFNDRGFSEQTIKKFRLGYSPEDRSALYKAATKQGFNRQLLFDTGLCVDDNRGGGYDRYRGRVIFPVIDLGGKIVAFGGRTLKKDKSVAKYVNSPESMIYSKRKEIYGLYQAKREIGKKNKCFIVEGYADVISMHQSGFENVIASSGTALTEEQIHKIHRFTNTVTEMFDGDEAGIKAALKGIDKILAEGLNMKVLLLPDDDDPDSYSRKHSASEIQQYIDNNESDFITFKTGILLKGTERDPIKRAQAIEEVTKSIAVIPTEVTRSIYAKECSYMFGIGEDVILRDIAKHILHNKEEQAKNNERSRIRQEQQEQRQEQQPQPVNSTDAAPQQVKTVQPENKVYTDAVIYPHERSMAKYIARYGMCDFCVIYNDGNGAEPTAHNATVIEYIYNELNIDNITFTTPVFSKIYNIAIAELENFYNDLQQQEEKVEAESEVLFNKLKSEIDPTGHNADSLKQEEDRIMAQVTAKASAQMISFRIHYLEKRLCSHPDDEVRNVACDLVSEKYTLSRIHTEHATIPTEYDKLETLLPGGLYNWKFALLEKRIAQVMDEIKTAQDELLVQKMQELQKLYNMRIQIAMLVGNRVVNPK